MTTDQRKQASQTHEQDSAAVRHKNHIDNVLRYPKAQDREHKRKGNDQRNDCALLPGLGQQIPVDLLNQRDHGIASSDHYENARPPGAEASKEAHKRAKGFMRPYINRAFAGKHQAKLSGNDSAWNEECNKANQPVDVSGWACTTSHHGGIADKEHNRHEDSDHVERVQHFRENTTGDTF